MVTGIPSLKTLRIKQGLTQAQLAEKVGVTTQSVSNYERQRSDPSLRTLNMIALVLGVTLQELLAGK